MSDKHKPSIREHNKATDGNVIYSLISLIASVAPLSGLKLKATTKSKDIPWTISTDSAYIGYTALY